MRYKNNTIKKDINNVRYYKPRIIPNVPIKDTDIFVYPLYGDRFDTIAQRYYNDSNLWWIIAKANEIGNGKIAPDPEKKLRIPTEIEDILESIDKAKEIGKDDINQHGIYMKFICIEKEFILPKGKPV